MVILFPSDESIIKCEDRKRLQWCAMDQEPTERVRSRWTAAVHVWGAISCTGKRVLVNVNDYTDGGLKSAGYLELVEKKFLKIYKDTQRENPTAKVLFLQDGSRVHTSREATEGLSRMEIETITDWPAHSPDLNPIENCWSILKSTCQQELCALGQDNTEENRADLWNTVSRQFRELEGEGLTNLTESFLNRLIECRDLHGHKIAY
jgi:transposase